MSSAPACATCGAPLRPGAHFCSACGASVAPVAPALDGEALLADPRARERLPAALRLQLELLLRARPAPRGDGPAALILADGGRGAERLLRRLQLRPAALPITLGPALDDEAAAVERAAALGAAGAVVLVSSALQLLGEGERARLSAAAAAARAPLVFAVLRMDACEDDADVADLEGRARSFAASLGCPALLFDGNDDAAAEGALRAALTAAAPGAPARLRQALGARVDDALACLPAPGTAELAAAEAALDEADARARSAARGQLEAAGAALREAWPARLRAMDAEARSHEAPSALERELRTIWVEASRRHLRLLLEAAAPARAAEAEAAPAAPPIGPAPALHEARRPRSPGLLAAAALTTVGVLLLPGASPAVAAAGLSLVAGSLLSARVVRLRHDGARGRLQEQAVLAWIDAGISACVAALDEQAGHWRAQLRSALRALHAAGGDPATETLRAGLRRLREGLRAEAGEPIVNDVNDVNLEEERPEAQVAADPVAASEAPSEAPPPDSSAEEGALVDGELLTAPVEPAPRGEEDEPDADPVEADLVEAAEAAEAAVAAPEPGPPEPGGAA